MKLWIIGNPIAGGGKAGPRIHQLRALLEARGHDVHVQLTTAAGDARQWSSELPGDVDRLIAAGGDGTLNEVINGLADPAAVPIIQMPVGTANVLTRELGLPWKPPGVADLVETGVVKRVDMGVLTFDKRMSSTAEAPGPQSAPPLTESEASRSPSSDSFRDEGDSPKPPAPPEPPSTESEATAVRRFLVIASAGFDAMVIQDIALHRIGTLGLRGYAMPVFRTWRRYRPTELTVTLDGGDPLHAAMVVVSNTNNYAGLFQVAERAAMDSGTFDVCLLPRTSLPALMRYAFAAWRKRLHTLHDVMHVQASTIRITSPEPVAVEADGEHVGATPVSIRIAPAAVPIVVPRG